MYDYEEEFTTEEQDIVNEAVEKFRGVLIKKRKEEWDVYQSNKEYLEKEKADFHAQRAALEKEKKAFEASRDTLYAQFKKDWFDELGLQFKVGDKVWYAYAEYKQKECPLCGGKKVVEIHMADGNITTCGCPKCNGKGYISVPQSIAKSGTITSIRVTLVRNEQNCYMDANSILSYINKCEIWMTSDDSGESRRSTSDDLYHTKEECEAAIEQAKQKEEK